MNAEAQQSDIRKYLGYGVFLVALLMAFTGIANSAPSFWIIPTIGPFPSEVIRPIILTGSVFIVLVRTPISQALNR